jgi:hypothetical protein
MMKPNVRFIEHYVTTGFSGTPVHGERFLPSPEAMRTFLAKVNPRKAPGKYCIFKPLSLFADSEEPEFVIFFARPEVLTGLFIQTEVRQCVFKFPVISKHYRAQKCSWHYPLRFLTQLTPPVR